MNDDGSIRPGSSLVETIAEDEDASFVDPHFGKDRPFAEDVDQFQKIIDEELAERKDEILAGGSIVGAKYRFKVSINKGYEPRIRHAKEEDEEGGGKGKGNGQGGKDGKDGKGAGSGDTEDEADIEYSAEVTWEELADFLFDNVELPNLKPKPGGKTKLVRIEISGIQPEGPDKLFHLDQTLLAYFMRILPHIRKDPEKYTYKDGRGKLRIRWDVIRRTLQMSDEDRRFNTISEIREPDIRVLCLLLLDRSASMDSKVAQGPEPKILLAKMFMRVALAYLYKIYGGIDLVIVRLAHDSNPHPIEDDEKFFKAETGGGTDVEPAFRYIIELIEKEFPAFAWNRFLWHVSDGDLMLSSITGEKGTKVKALLRQLMALLDFIGYFEVHASNDRKPWEQLGQIINSIPESERRGHIGLAVGEKVGDVLKGFIDILKQGERRA